MKLVRHLISIGLVISAATFIAVWLAVESRAQAPDRASLAGVWTLDHDLSDQPPARGDNGSGGGGDSRGRRGGGYGGRGMGRGGFGGGGMGRGGRGGDPEEMARMRDAMRDIMAPKERLTIVQTDSMISITSDDGRSTRLSPDNKKIKDDNTKIERKTKWDAGKLVSEISGIGPAKLTQTFSVDPERHLRIVVQMEGGRHNASRTTTHVYDPAEQH
jgi:hypothetical protein